MNIVQQVGTEYFSSRFSGCVFIGPSGNPHYIESINSSRSRTVNCQEVESPNSAKRITLPFDYFQSFKFLEVPEIGWRSAEGGRVLVRLERINTSYTRGITLKNLSKEYVAHTDYMFQMGKIVRNEVEKPSYLSTLITKPNHMCMSEGIAEMNKGKIMAFSNNAHVAVVPESDSVYNILCDSCHVANITPEGEISLMEGSEDFDLEIIQ